MSDTPRAELWEVARKLGYSRAEVDRMLRSASGSELLRRLQRRHARLTRRIERDEEKAWLDFNSNERRHAFDVQREVVDLDRRRDRRQLRLWERVFRVLSEASLAQEGTRAIGYEAKVAGGDGESLPPRLADRTLVDRIGEILEAAVERSERELDLVLHGGCTPSGERLNREIVECQGSPSLVALRFGVSETHVRKLRVSHGLQASDGRPRVRAA